MYIGGSNRIPKLVGPKVDLQIIVAISQRALTAEGIATVIKNTVSRYSITPRMLVRRALALMIRLPDVHFHLPKKPKVRMGTSRKHSTALDALDIPALCRYVREEIPEANDELITVIIHRLLD